MYEIYSYNITIYRHFIDAFEHIIPTNWDPNTKNDDNIIEGSIYLKAHKPNLIEFNFDKNKLTNYDITNKLWDIHLKQIDLTEIDQMLGI